MKITDIKAVEILDSRGNPTIQTSVYTDAGVYGTAAVPSGASTGVHEALELRDGDESRYFGKGVKNAISYIHGIIKEVLVGRDPSNQRGIDLLLLQFDGTPDKSQFGANAMLSVSIAAAVAAAKSENKELFSYLSKFNPSQETVGTMPTPMMNVLNGGKHANWATDIQEYMLIPVKVTTFAEQIRMCSTVYTTLKSVIEQKGYASGVGDEGGFAPAVSSNEEPFELLLEAIEKAGFTPGTDFCFGIDAAASEFYENGVYTLKRDHKKLNSEELTKMYLSLIQKYPIVSLEDPFSEDDWESFSNLNSKIGESVQLVGDDLYATNVTRLKKGIAEKSTNAILIKLNQIGTVSETMDTIFHARRYGMKCIISHRSGETEDTFASDFAVSMGTGQVKFGAPCRSEHTAKYNRILVIEDHLGETAKYMTYPYLKDFENGTS
jgi:enolase